MAGILETVSGAIASASATATSAAQVAGQNALENLMETANSLRPILMLAGFSLQRLTVTLQLTPCALVRLLKVDEMQVDALRALLEGGEELTAVQRLCINTLLTIEDGSAKMAENNFRLEGLEVTLGLSPAVGAVMTPIAPWGEGG